MWWLEGPVGEPLPNRGLPEDRKEVSAARERRVRPAEVLSDGEAWNMLSMENPASYPCLYPSQARVPWRGRDQRGPGYTDEILGHAVLQTLGMAAPCGLQGTCYLLREPTPIFYSGKPPSHFSPAHRPVYILLRSSPSIIVWCINAATCFLSGSCLPVILGQRGSLSVCFFASVSPVLGTTSRMLLVPNTCLWDE